MLPINHALKLFLASHDIKATPKFRTTGSLKGSTYLYQKGTPWSPELAAQLNRLGFRYIIDGSLLGEFNGNGGAFSVETKGPDDYSFLCPLDEAKKIAGNLRKKYGQPEGYGINFDTDGSELFGSTYRADEGLYSFDYRRKSGQTTVRLSFHRTPTARAGKAPAPAPANAAKPAPAAAPVVAAPAYTYQPELF